MFNDVAGGGRKPAIKLLSQQAFIWRKPECRQFANIAAKSAHFSNSFQFVVVVVLLTQMPTIVCAVSSIAMPIGFGSGEGGKD
uniref:Uncharacterized protein n=1 Tax=Globodera pallida TaxID=36090 RepID=A0A183CHL4_GLOPA